MLHAWSLTAQSSD